MSISRPDASQANAFQALKVICKDHEAKLAPTETQGRVANSVSVDIERLLNPKSLKDLEILERQVDDKLQSDEPIDVEYWEQLLRYLAVYKARAELDAVYKSVIESRLNELKQEQREEAEEAKDKLHIILDEMVHPTYGPLQSMDPSYNVVLAERSGIPYIKDLDPEPLLKLHAEDKGLDVMDENEFLGKIVSLKLLLLLYVRFMTDRTV